MKTALGELLEAVQHERKRILAEIDAAKSVITAKQAELRRYDKVMSAAGVESDDAKPKPKKRNSSNDWQVGETKIHLVYDTMVSSNGDGPKEYTVKTLSAATGLSDVTTQRAISALHSQGRIRLVRKEGLRKIWMVVA